jgi:hypothetical protein
MQDTMLIQITNPKAIKLLQELEELHLIKVVEEHFVPQKQKLSEKYKGVFTKDDAESFNNHTQSMRNEWNNT